MAPQDPNNVKSDIWLIYIDDIDAPFHSSVSIGEQLDIHPVTTQRSGSTPIAHLVQGHKCELTFEFQELGVEDLKRAMGISEATIAVNKLPTIGTRLGTHKIRLHNPTDGPVTTSDLVFPTVVFGSFTNTADGAGEATITVKAMAELDQASGDVVQLGYVAPV